MDVDGPVAEVTVRVCRGCHDAHSTTPPLSLALQLARGRAVKGSPRAWWRTAMPGQAAGGRSQGKLGAGPARGTAPFLWTSSWVFAAAAGHGIVRAVACSRLQGGAERRPCSTAAQKKVKAVVDQDAKPRREADDADLAPRAVRLQTCCLLAAQMRPVVGAVAFLRPPHFPILFSDSEQV